MAVSIKTTERVYGTKEAAEYLNLGTDTVRQYVHRGLLHAFDTLSGRYLFKESELRRYNSERKPPGRRKDSA
jgi:excisionase family DNA binding protein